MAKIDINFIFENDFTCLFVLYGMKFIKLNVFNNIGIVFNHFLNTFTKISTFYVTILWLKQSLANQCTNQT